ncbi:MAG: hypothetical protein WCD21_40820, partial [Streptomyces sp.]
PGRSSALGGLLMEFYGIGGLALAAGFGVTSPALTGAALAVLGLGVAGVAYLVDLRSPSVGSERLVASGEPVRESSHAG